MDESYAYAWEFRVPSHSLTEFERHYGPDGTWARLFRQSAGYMETLLLKDCSTDGRYVTIDRWRSKDAHAAFRSAFSLQYAQLDEDCEALTSAECFLGEFTEPCQERPG